MRHTKVRISYDNQSLKPEACRYEKMCNAFYEVANLVEDSKNTYKNVMTQICEMKGELKEGGNAYGSNKPISIDIQNDSTSCDNGLVISKKARKILDPMVVSQKGRPPFKMKTITIEGNVVDQVETSILEEIFKKVRL